MSVFTKFERIVIDLSAYWIKYPELATHSAIRSSVFDEMIDKYGKIAMSSVKSWWIVDELTECIEDRILN